MKIYLGLVGCYRTFEKTYKNLFSHLIDNNPKCNFDIYINTETKPKYVHKKWGNRHLKKKYLTEEKLTLSFHKYYKSHLKKITYYTHEKGYPIFERMKILINEHHANETKYDLYIFMRIDCIFVKKLDIYHYVNQLDTNIVKLICRDQIVPKRFDHNRDWDMGILSKNIHNIQKFICNDFNNLTPDDKELKQMSKIIKCKNVFSMYELPLPLEIEKQYKSNWHYDINCRIYSFNKLIAPLWYEDTFFLRILR